MPVHKKTETFAIEQFRTQELEQQFVWLRVNDHVRLLRKYMKMQVAAAKLTAGWIPCCTDWPRKERMARFAYEDIQHAALMKKRLDELSSGAKSTPTPEWMQRTFDAIGKAGNIESFWNGMYLVVKKRLLGEYESYLLRCDPLFDAPTIDVLQAVIPQLREQIAAVNGWLKDALADAGLRESMAAWARYADKVMDRFAERDERDAAARTNTPPDPAFDLPPSPVARPMGPVPDSIVMPDWMNNDVKDYNLITREQMPLKGTLRETIWHLATEMQAVDQMSYLFYGLDMPFEFFVDFSRHMWDETRHSLIGVRRLAQMGYDYKALPMPYNDKPPESLEDYFGILTMIGEACSFGRKHAAIDRFYKHNDPLSAIHQEYDCSDEQTHVRYGKKWLPAMFGLDERTTTLQDLIEQIRGKSLAAAAGLSEEERQRIVKRSSGFCGFVEFKHLNLDVY